MTKILKDEFKLPISEANAFLIPIVAKEFGYIEESEMTPEEAILNHFKARREETRGRVYNAVSKYFGEAGKTTVAQIMALYDAEGVLNISFKDEQQ